MTQDEIDKLIDQQLTEMIQENGPKMMSFMLSMMGKQVAQAGGETLKISQNQDIENKRYKVSALITVKEIKKQKHP